MHSYSLAIVLLAGTALALPPRFHAAVKPSCPIVFDGRIPVGTAPTSFDTYATATYFNPDYVKNLTTKWSEILKFPTVDPSRFDGTDYIPLEVTVNDKSIFQTQNGFRRAGLQFLKDTSDGPGTVGVKTLHWSVRQDAARPLNLTHEYLNAWHEAADYSSNQIQFQAGQIIGGSAADKNNFKILNRSGKSLYSVAIDKTNWQNFAIKLDYNQNQVQIYYSVGAAALKSVAGPVAADISGGGQFQLGILKKPTGTSDVVNGGYQEKNLNEGQIYGGLFLEDSADGCVTL
ncbi:glycoside hydrolase family 131 protein [Pleomassaria siparia CBS 279.74]|uniref:Glycoside hydrolase family 131 protein n=1 Tax=Pleomassaria siparia CBS 279.74 TaxID=1314801 RepID=A0A6G1KC76_9PLEO|nr:glycoside hydrolase family 131 protein [Pleomassaria siparia CBS 279.74]